MKAGKESKKEAPEAIHGKKPLQGIFRDITERKKAEKLIKESERKYHTLFETSSDAIMMLDKKGFFDCNKATLQIFGLSSKEQFIKKHPSELSPPKQPDGKDSLTAANERIETAYKKGSNFFEWMHKRADGTVFPATVLLSRLELHGKYVLQAVVRDITEQKKAEEELKNLNQVLKSKVEQLERFNKLAVGRELKMIELKKRIKVLERELAGRQVRA